MSWFLTSSGHEVLNLLELSSSMSVSTPISKHWSANSQNHAYFIDMASNNDILSDTDYRHSSESCDADSKTTQGTRNNEDDRSTKCALSRPSCPIVIISISKHHPMNVNSEEKLTAHSRDPGPAWWADVDNQCRLTCCRGGLTLKSSTKNGRKPWLGQTHFPSRVEGRRRRRCQSWLQLFLSFISTWTVHWRRLRWVFDRQT